LVWLAEQWALAPNEQHVFNLSFIIFALFLLTICSVEDLF